MVALCFSFSTYLCLGGQIADERKRIHLPALSAEVGSAALLAITPGPVVLGDLPDPLPAQRAVPRVARPAHQEVVGARLFIQESKRAALIAFINMPRI